MRGNARVQMIWQFLLIYTHLSMGIKFHYFKTLPFLKHTSSSNYVFIAVCNECIISKDKQSCKKLIEKQQHITTATLRQSFPLHGQWEVKMHGHDQALPAVSSMQKPRTTGSFPQTALSLSCWDSPFLFPLELGIKLKNALTADTFHSKKREALSSDDHYFWLPETVAVFPLKCKVLEIMY